MDIALYVIAILLLLIGIVGAVLPVLPGPVIAFAGFLCFWFTSFSQFSLSYLLALGGVAVLVTILDYFVPLMGARRWGGGRGGSVGAVLGLLLGLFFMPLGIILGPFLGAVLGELIVKHDFPKALKSGFGTFVGFLFGTILKVVYALYLLTLVLLPLFR